MHAAISRRYKTAAKTEISATGGSAFWLAGVALIAAGFVVSTFGSAWEKVAAETLYGYPLTAIPERYLPFWPFEPFLPLAVIIGGIYLVTFSGRTAAGRSVTSDPARKRAIGA